MFNIRVRCHCFSHKFHSVICMQGDSWRCGWAAQSNNGLHECEPRAGSGGSLPGTHPCLQVRQDTPPHDTAGQTVRSRNCLHCIECIFQMVNCFLSLGVSPVIVFSITEWWIGKVHFSSCQSRIVVEDVFSGLKGFHLFYSGKVLSNLQKIITIFSLLFHLIDCTEGITFVMTHRYYKEFCSIHILIWFKNLQFGSVHLCTAAV